MATKRSTAARRSSRKPTSSPKRQYQRHGSDKKAMVIAALLAGGFITEIAEEYGVPKSTVGTWKAELTPEQIEQIRNKQGAGIEEKIINYLGANLDALAAQAKVAADPAYLRRQSGSDLAVLHGVMLDKGVRILEASQMQGAPRAQADEEEPEEPKQIGSGTGKAIDVEAKPVK